MEQLDLNTLVHDDATRTLLVASLGAAGGVVGGVLTVFARRWWSHEERRNRSQASAADASTLLAQINSMGESLRIWREEVDALRKEVLDLRPLRDEVVRLRRQVGRLHDWLAQHGLPLPPTTDPGESD